MTRSRITLLTMMKDEGAALLEWVAYHRLIGAERLCVYTNDCTDGTDAMLDRLEAMGLVRHFANPVPEGGKPQPHALRLAGANPQVTGTDWLLVLDADEFVSVKVGEGRFDDLLAAVPDQTDAIALTWRTFGSDDRVTRPEGLVIDSYTRAAPDEFWKGWGVKTLFRPFPDMRLGIHRPRMRGAGRDAARLAALYAQHWVNGSGDPLPDAFKQSGWRSVEATLGYDLAEMNHYAVKSHEEYLLRRLRGNVNLKADKYDTTYFSLFDRNEVSAPAIRRHVPAVAVLVEELRADPVLGPLEQQALAHQAARLEGLRRSGAYDRWIAELAQAATLPFEEVDDVLYIKFLSEADQARIAAIRASGVPDREIARSIARRMRVGRPL